VPDDALRSLPAVDRLLRATRLTEAGAAVTHEVLLRVVRTVLEEERAARVAGTSPNQEDALLQAIARRLNALAGGARRVINGTGVILHTNLGRAPLSPAAVAAMGDAAAYQDLELNLRSGERGSRQERVAELLRVLTGAGDALVVGSNAAAVLLVLTALCRGRDVLVSRGQAVEIGGGFRVPEILRQSGARLVDVGTTNRTRIADFAATITPRTGALLHVHASNFRIVGFSEAPMLEEVAALAHQYEVPLLVDNGSGALLDTAQFGLAHEPTPREALECGADLVAFSGDKLLGGPQSGMILGRVDLVRRLARHPLTRAIRPDKLILAALAATLRAYVRGEAATSVPVWRMIAQRPEELAERASRFRDEAARHGLSLETTPGESTVGGGSLPGETLPTMLLVAPPDITAAALRLGSLPVIARTQGGRVLLDLRTVPPEDENDLLAALLRTAP
jgi:L-seryl-tRNA(Ser) seleniumtransferase